MDQYYVYLQWPSDKNPHFTETINLVAGPYDYAKALQVRQEMENKHRHGSQADADLNSYFFGRQNDFTSTDTGRFFIKSVSEILAGRDAKTLKVAYRRYLRPYEATYLALIDPSEKGIALWYNGVYRSEGNPLDSFLRFYEGGTVLNAAIRKPYDLNDFSRWLSKTAPGIAQGRYTGDEGKLSFTTRWENNIVDYEGRIVDIRTIHLTAYGRHSGERKERDYKFIHVPWLED